MLRKAAGTLQTQRACVFVCVCGFKGEFRIGFVLRLGIGSVFVLLMVSVFFNAVPLFRGTLMCCQILPVVLWKCI